MRDNWQDRKSVVGLNEQMFRDQQSFGTLQERIWIIDRRTEIARCALPVLNGKRVAASMPFQALVAQSECVAVRGRNYGAARSGTALGVRKINPNAPQPKGPFEIVEPHIDIVLGVVSVLCNERALSADLLPWECSVLPLSFCWLPFFMC
jgi:hypothetical protein